MMPSFGYFSLSSSYFSPNTSLFSLIKSAGSTMTTPFAPNSFNILAIASSASFAVWTDNSTHSTPYHSFRFNHSFAFECFFKPFEQRVFPFRYRFVISNLIELSQQFFLATRQFRRRHDSHLHMLVAMAISSDIRSAFPS